MLCFTSVILIHNLGQMKFHNSKVLEIWVTKPGKINDPTDVIKFGRRVNYETKDTSQGVMEEHLK